MKRFTTSLMLAFGICWLAGCGDSDDQDAGEAQGPTLYAVNSVVFGEEASSTYLSLVGELDGEELDFDLARELPGTADIWWHDGALFVTLGDDITVTKYTVEAGKLVEGETISFANFGITNFGFWLNSFVAPDKAYMLNGTTEYVVWNPQTMEIGETFDIPALEAREGLTAYQSYGDRAAIVRDGLLYQPFYYTDPKTFFSFDAATSIVVVDTKTDQVVDVIEAPCPGLDFATRDDDDNLYFSSWVFAPGGAAVLDQPSTCVVKVAAGSDKASRLFDFPDVTSGRQGGAFRHLADGKAFLSVLHPEDSDKEDVADVAYGANWHFWLYDLANGTATEMQSIDRNAGAAYDSKLDGKPHLLVPAGDYTSTQLFEVGTDGSTELKLSTKGWALRAFELK